MEPTTGESLAATVHGSPDEPLRPAIVAWIAVMVWTGVCSQAHAFVWAANLTPNLWIVLYAVDVLSFAGLVVWFVRGDADARRVWVRPRPRMVELCLLVGTITAIVLARWEEAIPSEFAGPSVIRMEYDAGWPLWVCLVSSAVLPAVLEELLYRGLLLTRFLRVLSQPLAIALQAMLFAVMHFDTVYLLPHFVFGVVAGVFRVAAGALWPCMLMHFLWNGNIVLQVFGWW